MKKFLVFLCIIFICTICFAHTINWHVGDQIISTTTCSSGDDITPPSAPVKYGYDFKEWRRPDYMELEYIESTGTQWIDTGVKVAGNLDINLRVKLLSFLPNSAVGGVFGNRSIASDDGTLDAVWFGVTSLRTLWLYNNETKNNHLPVLALNTWYEINTVGGKYYLDNSLVAEYSNATFYNSKNIFLFAAGSSIGADMQVSSFEISGIINLVPAKRVSDGAVGMYDTVSNTFFENQGTGEFIAGPVVGGIR